MGFDVEGIGDAAAVLEGGVSGAVDEAHGSAVGVFVWDEVEAHGLEDGIFLSYGDIGV